MNKQTLVSLLAGIVLAAGTGHAQKPNPRAEVHNPAKFDSDENDLDQNHGHEVSSEHRPLLNLPRQSQANNRPDGALQGGSGPVINTVDGTGLEGVSASGYAPPDTNMAIGPNHIVQWVNVRFAIYDKAGNMYSGYPKPGNAFWQGFGGPCETQNSGDPIIQYDAVADRWIASQFTSSGSPYYQCFAISKTGDPTGAYNRYSYAFTNFPDYPKITVWKNAYFASYNMFSGTSGAWVGPQICAYDRAAMLAGTNAIQECFSWSGGTYGSLVPSDLDGGSGFAPPSNTGYFMDYGNNSLLLWRFTPDFVTPANASLVGPISMAAASFSPACGGGTCIPQPGGQNLDSLADRLMYRLAYRNFGDHEAMVVNQSVTAGTSVGVRWYEIRNPLTNPTIYQQGTFAPDSTYRWMGSVAMDKTGNIAVGYSASSSTAVPSIRYAGRETIDPLGTLQAEQVIFTGGGSQTGLSRWGDYAAMRIDPTDDCTFWFTSEYIPADGSFNWHTRIASFKFNSCGVAVPDFSLTATPASTTAVQGSPASYTATVGSLNSFAGVVGLAVSGLPTGATATFTPPSVTGSGSSTLSVPTSGSTPAGSYTLTITGTSGSLVHSTPVTLVVQAAAPPDFSLSATPSSKTVVQGSPASYTATVGSLNGFAGTVGLAVSGLPTGATATFTPPSVTGSGPSTLNVSTTASTPVGSYTLTITGTSGSLVHSTPVTLVVQAAPQPDFGLSATPASNTIAVRQSATYTISVVNKINGFNSAVTFSVSGLLPKTSATFSPSSSTSGTTLTVKANASAKAGTTTLVITGTGGGKSHTVSVGFTIK